MVVLSFTPFPCGLIPRRSEAVKSRVVISEEGDYPLKAVCEAISKRFEIKFLEIGTEQDHIHVLVQSAPTYSPTKIVTTIKSIIAKKIFEKHPKVKKQLWGGAFWTDGHLVSTVSKYGNEQVRAN